MDRDAILRIVGILVPIAIVLGGGYLGMLAMVNSVRSELGAEIARSRAKEAERELRSTEVVADVFERLGALEGRAEGLPALRAAYCSHLANLHAGVACGVPEVP